MENRTLYIIGAGIVVAVAALWYVQSKPGILQVMTGGITEQNTQPRRGQTATAMLAGGCFWCVESDLEKVPGVLSVVSGYSGGTSQNPTYQDYSSGGHREVVEVTYDPANVSYEGLVEYFLKHIDPTDPEGSFGDRGFQYSPAIYYETDEERQAAEEVLKRIEERGVFDTALAVPVEKRQPFWPAEEYHQDYYKHHSLKYKFYRRASGRDAFIEKYWGTEAGEFPAAETNSSFPPGPWQSFTKPSEEELKVKLSAEQFKVTQKEGTERPFDNEYWDNYEDGIYVDIVSGEPLFSSRDIFKSGTGWPSFTKPLTPENIVEKPDRSFLLIPRTEIRSRYGDSHLGHVFNDGPDPTGLRYCMNSAALRFVPKEQMEAEGYGDYLPFL